MTATVVLVHGSWIGPECWGRVAHHLRQLDVATVVVDRTDEAAGGRIIGDVVANVACVHAALDAIDGPVILCGHSAGVSIVSRAAVGRPRVRELVAIAGFLTKDAETPIDLAGPPSPELQAALSRTEPDTVAFDPDAARALFFQDCAPAITEDALHHLRPQQLGRSVAHGIRGGAWQDRPTTYVVCAEDRALAPAVQRRIAARATCTVEWPVGHAPQYARPELVAALLYERARASSS